MGTSMRSMHPMHHGGALCDVVMGSCSLQVQGVLPAHFEGVGAHLGDSTQRSRVGPHCIDGVKAH